jgi:hypothetical protein
MVRTNLPKNNHSSHASSLKFWLEDPYYLESVEEPFPEVKNVGFPNSLRSLGIIGIYVKENGIPLKPYLLNHPEYGPALKNRVSTLSE